MHEQFSKKKKKGREREGGGGKLKLEPIFQGFAKSWEGRYRPIAQGWVEQVSSPLSQFLLTFTNSLAEFLLESGRHDINLAMGSRI